MAEQIVQKQMIPVQDLGAVARNKGELERFLRIDNDCYLCHRKHVTVYHYRDLVNGTKKVCEVYGLCSFDVPLSVFDLFCPDSNLKYYSPLTFVLLPDDQEYRCEDTFCSTI